MRRGIWPFWLGLKIFGYLVSVPARSGENAFLDVSLDIGLGIVAFLAQDKLLDETIQHVLKLKIGKWVGVNQRRSHQMTD